MTEMLANYYFINHQFDDAILEYKAALQHDQLNLNLMKKLLVTYILTGSVDQAYQLFSRMVLTELPCIVNTYDIEEICPFAELHRGLSDPKEGEKKGVNFYLTMGMIWLFKDVSRSIKFLEQAHSLDRNDQGIAKVIQSLREYQVSTVRDTSERLSN